MTNVVIGDDAGASVVRGCIHALAKHAARSGALAFSCKFVCKVRPG